MQAISFPLTELNFRKAAEECDNGIEKCTNLTDIWILHAVEPRYSPYVTKDPASKTNHILRPSV